MSVENIELDLGRWFRLKWRMFRPKIGAPPLLVTTVTSRGEEPDPMAKKVPAWMKPQKCTMRIDVTKDDEDCDFPEPLEPFEVKDGEGWITDDKGQQQYARWREFGWKIRPVEAGTYVFKGEFTGPDGQESESFEDDVTVKEGEPLNDKRQAMLDIINKWMPCSLLGQGYPQNKQPDTRPKHGDGKLKSLLELAGWTEQMGNSSKAKADYNNFAAHAGNLPGLGFLKEAPPIPVATSCGDTVKALLELWGVDWDQDGSGKSQAFGVGIEARKKGWYVDVFEAYSQDPPLQPKPGDILCLRQGDGPHMKAPYPVIGSLAHVCVVQSFSTQMLVTADGGGGVLPDQVAKADNEKTIDWTTGNAGPPDKYYGMPWPQVKEALKKQGMDGMFDDGIYPNGLPCVYSTTDGKSKMIDGWVDLDRVPNLNSDWNEDVDTSTDEYQARMEKAQKFTAMWNKITGGKK